MEIQLRTTHLPDDSAANLIVRIREQLAFQKIEFAIFRRNRRAAAVVTAMITKAADVAAGMDIAKIMSMLMLAEGCCGGHGHEHAHDHSP